MLSARLSSLLLAFLFLAQGCGRLSETFGRDKSQYTRVNFNAERAPFAGIFSQDGYVMIYFTRGSGQGGLAFGFNNEADVIQNSIVVPNGVYQVYALSFAGPAAFEGQARCALGNGGAEISLTGSAQTISIDLTTANCGFNTNGIFSGASASTSGINFDVLSVKLCTNTTYPSCSLSGGPLSMKVAMLGGEGPPNSNIVNESPFYTRITGCLPFAAGTANTNLRIPVGGNNFSPPLKILFFNDSTCTTAVSSTYMFVDGGLKSRYGAANGTTSYLSSPGNTTTTLSVFKDF